MKRRALLAALPLAFSGARAAAPAACIAPAKPGGGFELTCQLVQALLQLPLPEPAATVEVRYLPGGIGALAFDRAVAQHWSDPRTFVAFSTGSLVNLAQGKFGPHRAQDVRWLASLGVEYGVVAVRKDSPLRSLADLRTRLHDNASGAVFGASGSVGGQDWIKAALLVRAAGSDHRAMRFVSFEGGGQAIAALQGGYVDVFCGDAAEARAGYEAGRLKLLAVLAPRRLGAPFEQVPTAREQGLDVVWPTLRGLYMGPGVRDADYQAWARTFRRILETREAAALLRARGLQPLVLTGPELTAHVQQEVARMRALALELRLRVP